MASLIEHLESFLGQIEGGWSDDVDLSSGLQVIRFADDVPFNGVTTLVTVGLSDQHLEAVDGRGSHQELLMHVPNRWGNLGPSLLDFARDLERSGRALRRGDVVELGSGFLGQGDIAALWAYTPGYLPAEFEMCVNGDRTIVIAWLIPITTAEINLVRHHGWRALEEAFASDDPDLTDIDRLPVSAANNHSQ